MFKATPEGGFITSFLSMKNLIVPLITIEMLEQLFRSFEVRRENFLTGNSQLHSCVYGIADGIPDILMIIFHSNIVNLIIRFGTKNGIVVLPAVIATIGDEASVVDALHIINLESISFAVPPYGLDNLIHAEFFKMSRFASFKTTYSRLNFGIENLLSSLGVASVKNLNCHN